MKPIKEIKEIWWNKYNEDETLLKQPTVWNYYENYNVKILPSDKTGSMIFRFMPSFTICLGNSVLFDGGLIIDYYLQIDDLAALKNQILRLGIDSHKTFMETFKEREATSALRFFEPIYYDYLLKNKLDLHLHPTLLGIL